ncbi:ribosomal protein S21 component of cytosolic 80S ribosome and 40S small subunit [Dunaliella salina]|uniref:40S ribosomal protein S21 n=1 Tax=Dunaliella salina TaxID=3046 RepID=A0ABQ7HAW9_DUNSA|nr:ribosomal protein S21 component of cytosolic 80S ribosome and 40S small subunit [Dunaliella salina]|mmetsp:Transcript_14241/g.38599  ORF Transcript_14241/g.38599 Transcript_14241/m.38599 type:complete len:82 (+) Transcript_14241:126-371(+)|eukprot:KAF5843921.1 ribosomal protein S21 component of cytosolic 80S ribosome and 40S small subunit [Dunaliella salina]
MINDEGNTVDLYIPRKCAWTNKLIEAKDHASVQINIGHLDENGVYKGTFDTFAMIGKIRAQGESDHALDLMWKKKQAEAQA